MTPTVGHITRAIGRAFRRSDTDTGLPRPNWFLITKKHFERYGKRIGKPVKVAGPFGICCRFTVKVGRRERVFEMDNDSGWHMGRRDYSRRDTTFKPGSIGALNGMNYPYETIPNCTPLDDLFS